MSTIDLDKLAEAYTLASEAGPMAAWRLLVEAIKYHGAPSHPDPNAYPLGEADGVAIWATHNVIGRQQHIYLCTLTQWWRIDYIDELAQVIAVTGRALGGPSGHMRED